MKIYIHFLSILCFTCLSLSASKIRVATLNVNNYLLIDRMVDGAYCKNYPKPQAEKKALHNLLLTVSPDILVLQEMGDYSFLKELQTDLKALGLDYPYTYLLEGPDPQRHLATLSKYKPIKNCSNGFVPFKYFGREINVRRGLLGLEFKHNGVTWSLYTLHLKSQYKTSNQDPKSAIMRKAEAYALRNFIYNNTKNPYLVMGDFNDNHYTPAVKVFLKRSKKVQAHLIPTYDSRLEAWTFHNSKSDNYSRLDYILPSSSMMPFIKEKKAHIADKLPESLIASDHRLLYVDLEF